MSACAGSLCTELGLVAGRGFGNATERVRLWVGAKCTLLTEGGREEPGELATTVSLTDDSVRLRDASKVGSNW